MKAFLKEYTEIIMYTICGILIILSSYTIIVNINHARYLNKEVFVSDKDHNLIKFKDNIIKLENAFNNSSNNTYKRIVYLMKNDGLYKKIPGDKIRYKDLYFLNNYFLDTIINDGYISSIKVNNQVDKIVDKYIYNLINNANYICRELENNSNYQYDVLNNDIRDAINEQYQMIVNNYLQLSEIILEMSDNIWKKVLIHVYFIQK